jgi:cell division protein FtsI (penicillin-binding protein 3)
MMPDAVMKKQGFWHVVIVLGMLFAAFGVSARVAYVHIVKSDFLKLEGERHYKRNIPQYAYRGNILDTEGRELAVSAPSASIWADPSDLLADIDGLMNISRLMKLDFYALKRRAEKLRHLDFMYIERQVEPAKAARIESVGHGLVSKINERKRLYPEGSVFSHIIGVTDIDGNGVEGIELAFNEHLQGSDGEISVIRDRLGRSFEIIDRPKEKVDGSEVRLSVDRNIQYIGYSELRAALARHEATSGMLIVLDVKRSKVLSVVNYPAYNPNDRRAMGIQNIRNRAVTDIFEPGSSIKPFIVAAALESGRLKPTDEIDVSPGYISLAGKKIKDSRNYQSLNVAGVLAKSSNVGIVKISRMIDDAALAEKLRDYGLFSASGIELPGESAGLIVPQPEWGSTYKDYLSFGYGAALSAMQLANSYMVLANRGIRKDISILDDSESGEGVRVMDPLVAATVLDMLQGVVDKEGTGTAADTRAYRVAGKTGTAKKLKDGVYQDDAYVAVFTGIAPVADPSIVVAIIVNDPRKNGFYGGQVAAPVFSRVASRVLRYLDIRPDVEKLALSETALPDRAI